MSSAMFRMLRALALGLLVTLFVSVCTRSAHALEAPDSDKTYRAGIGFANKGMNDLAANELREYLRAQPDGKNTLSARYTLAVCLVRLGDHAGAEKELELVLEAKDFEFAPDARFLRAQCELARGDDAAAIGTLKRLLKDKPNFAQADRAALLYGELLYKAGRFAQAKTVLDSFAKKWPTSDQRERAEYFSALTELGNANPAAAAEKFEAILKASPNGPLASHAAEGAVRSHMQLARLLNDQGKTEEAAAQLEKLAAKYPKSNLLAEIKFDQAAALTRAGKDEAASKAWHAWRAEYGTQELAADALAAEATCLYRLGKYSESLTLCELFLGEHLKSGQGASVSLLFAENLYLVGEHARALEAFERFAKEHAEDAGAWRAQVRSGQCLSLLGKSGEAEKVLAAAVVETVPQDPALRVAALYVLGEAAFTASDWGAAEKWFGQITKERDGDVDALLRSGLSVQRQGRFADALVILERAAKAGGETAQGMHARFECAQVLVELNRLDEAKELFASVAAEGPANLHVHSKRQLASIASRQGHAEEAANILAGTLDGTEADAGPILLQQASAWLAAGRYSEAEAAYGKYIASKPGEPKASEARVQRAIAMNRQGRHKDAAEELRVLDSKLSGLDATVAASGKYELALALRSLGQDKEAGDVYRTLLAQQISPSVGAYASLDLAQIEIGAGRHAEAIVLLDHSKEYADRLKKEEAAPVRAREVYLRGACLFALGKPAEASTVLESLRGEVASEELLRSAAILRGDALAQSGRAADAAAEFAGALASGAGPDVEPVLLLKLGDAYTSASSWTKSEEAFGTFLEKYKDHALWFRARFGQGWARENQGRADAAIEAYALVVAGHEGATAARAQFQIGECLYGQKKFERAVGEFLKVDVLYAYPEWSAAALYEAGRCFKELGKTSEAAKQFADLESRFPESQWAKLAKANPVVVTTAELPGRATETTTR